MQTPINHTWNYVKLIWSILILYESHWISLTPNFCDGLKGFGSGPAAPAGCQVESRIWRAQLKPSATQRQHLWQQVRATASGLGHLGICLSPKSTTYSLSTIKIVICCFVSFVHIMNTLACFLWFFWSKALVVQNILIWVCLKIGYTRYTPNYSHLIGIMIINHCV